MEVEYVTVTREFLEQGLTKGIGCKRQQAEILGVWPLRHGWQQRALGTVLTKEDADRYLRLKGAAVDQEQRQQDRKTKPDRDEVVVVLTKEEHRTLKAVLRKLEKAAPG